jgi:hypothetical protein
LDVYIGIILIQWRARLAITNFEAQKIALGYRSLMIKIKEEKNDKNKDYSVKNYLVVLRNFYHISKIFFITAPRAIALYNKY